MRRTLLVSVPPAVVVSVLWARLESPHDALWRVAAVAALALAPALPGRARLGVVAGLVALVVAIRVAFGLSLLDARPFDGRHDFFGPLWGRFRDGFLTFYDVRVPFDPRVQTEMRGVVFAAVFGFVLVLGLAVSLRRPAPALLALLVGAGWPATLAGNRHALGAGAAILLGALVLLAGLTRRRPPRGVVVAGAAVALAAVGVASSSAVAKGELVSWQRWDFHSARQAPVSVSYVWNAQYEGIRFPATRTTVLRVKAPARSLFWRAAVLDEFADDRWVEAAPLAGDALEPAASHDRSQLVRQEVEVAALADTRLVGASVPVAYSAGSAPIVRLPSGGAILPAGLSRGFRYTVWSYAPEPTAAALARSRPSYPRELVAPGRFLDVWPGLAAPPFGTPGRAAEIARLMDEASAVQRYAPLERAALEVAGRARTPYAAAAALETWFRSTGGFRYTDQPAVYGPAPLVGFVAETRAGYCQYFAGAMALMLRYLGVPARVAVGFSSGSYDAGKGVWTVSDHDAHAWVEAWFAGYGWLPFDPTPSVGRPERGTLSAPYAAVARTRAAGGGAAAGQGPTNGTQTDARHREGSRPSVASPPAAGGGRHWRSSLPLALVLLVAAVVVAVVATKLGRRRARYLTRDPRRVAAACRQELVEFLVDQRIEAARSATLHELGALLRHELAVDPDRFVAAATAARFGPEPGAGAAAHAARRELRRLVRTVRARLTRLERLRGLLSLRSLGFA